MPSTKVILTTAIIALAVIYVVNHVDAVKNIVEG